MNEKFNKNAKVEQLQLFLGCGEEKGLIVKGPSLLFEIEIAFKPASTGCEEREVSVKFKMKMYVFSRI